MLSSDIPVVSVAAELAADVAELAAAAAEDADAVADDALLVSEVEALLAEVDDSAAFVVAVDALVLLERRERGACRLLHLFIVVEHALEQLLHHRLEVDRVVRLGHHPL